MYSKQITADTENITAGRRGVLKRILLTGVGAAATLVVYDSLTNAGTPIAKYKCPSDDSREFEPNLPFSTGLSVDITGANAEAYLYLD